MTDLLFMNIGAPEIMILLLFGGIPFVLMVYCILDILKSRFKDDITKHLYLILVVLFPLLGSIIYLLFSPKQKLS